MKQHALLYVEELGELFVDVQLQKVFDDQKFFADCIPKFSVEDILKQYKTEKEKKRFKLFDFCERNFDFPIDDSIGFVSDKSKTVEEHINILWDVLTKKTDSSGGTLIKLPHPFVVPGGRFREIYYWDSYFTMLGLQVSRKIELIENMIDNFAYLIDEFGFIPNGNRSYFLSRSQPPFFSMMIELLSEEKGNQIFLKYLPQLEKEYQYWMRGQEELDKKNTNKRRVVLMPDGEIMNRYWDDLNEPRQEAYIDDLETSTKSNSSKKQEVFRNIRAAAESGWDFSSRWFRDENDMSTICTTEIIPVDLNCLMHHLEKILSISYKLKNDNRSSEKYHQFYLNREAAIHKYLWNDSISAFGDYNFKKNSTTERITSVITFPLFLNIATKKQSVAAANKVTNDFLKQGGVVTTLSQNHQQWDAPNGWAPIQWYAYKGLMNYGFDNPAKFIQKNWTSTVDKIFKNTGRLTEKYNVIDLNINASGGEYPNQDGFGWTNGVYMKFKSV